MRPAEQIRRRDGPPTMAQIQIQAPLVDLLSSAAMWCDCLHIDNRHLVKDRLFLRASLRDVRCGGVRPTSCEPRCIRGINMPAGIGI